MCIIDVNNKDKMFFARWMLDGMDDFVVETFLTNLCISNVFLSQGRI